MINFYTHAGRFHCDEVLAFVLFDMFTSSLVKVHRLRDLKGLDEIQEGIVVDIGRKYDPEALRFDHHQMQLYRKGGTGTIYASAGLIWKHYGYAIANKYLDEYEEPADVYRFCDIVDRLLISGVDAHDADEDYEVWGQCAQDGMVMENLHITTLSNVVGMFNHFDVNDDWRQMRNFEQAAAILRTVVVATFERAASIIKYRNKYVWHLARVEQTDRVMDVLDWQAELLQEGGDINVAALVDLSEDNPEPAFLLMRSAHPGNKYQLLALSEHPETRRLRLPIERRGGFDGFIHNNKFIAGHDDPEVLRKLAADNVLDSKAPF